MVINDPDPQASERAIKRMIIENAPLAGYCEKLIETLSPDSGITPGMKNTPRRMADALREMTSGYDENLSDILTTFDNGDDRINYDEMVVVSPVRFFSLCEHHVLPFFGVASVAYIPDKKVIGLSKIARVVEHFARRFQVQERLTGQIANVLELELSPQGVGVVLKGIHLCMWARGADSQAVMTTSRLVGAMRDDPKARAEFLDLARSTEITLR